MDKYDFSGWATRHNVKCADGRTIMKDAFKHCDGITVPLVWNHDHGDQYNVLGHALLKNRDEGVYAYCTFNDTERGQHAKKLVVNRDIRSLSIYANQLKQQGGQVLHGYIRELSLVHAGANPEAFIEDIITHSDGEDEVAIIFTGEAVSLELAHSADEEEKKEEAEEKKEEAEEKKEEEPAEDNKEEKSEDNETLQDVLDTLNEKQETAVYGIIGTIVEDYEQKMKDLETKKGVDEEMKHNVFEQDKNKGTYLSHAAQEEIIALAKTKGVGSLQEAIAIYLEDHKDTLAHGIDEIETLFPEYKDVRPGAPELLTTDQGWVTAVMNGVHKSPISRIRTRQADIRNTSNLRAKGYKKGEQKTLSGNIKLLSRTTDPQTVYRKDALHRDDIIDIKDFDVVQYQYNVMKLNLNEELALAFMIGDGREDGDVDKIDETHIRSIWHDDELYVIHKDVDLEAARAELQGSNTAANFGENYIYAEAMIQSALYAREEYKGSGNLAMYCDPHILNVMLLARDLNGRRIYSSKNDLQAALNVSSIHTAEQFAGKTRTTADGKTKKLLAIFVNLNDYYVGATKGGEITKFNQFDIDYNQEKYLIETRISGALVRVKSAIVLEEDVTA